MMGKLWNTGPALQRMAGCSSKFIYFCRECIFNGGSVATAIATCYILTCLWKKNRGVPINRFCSSDFNKGLTYLSISIVTACIMHF